MKKRTNDVEFMSLYIKAMKKKMTLQEFARSIGITYQSVMMRKKKIAEITGKRLPPLQRQRKFVDVDKIVKLVDDSYSEHKRLHTTSVQ